MVVLGRVLAIAMLAAACGDNALPSDGPDGPTGSDGIRVPAGREPFAPGFGIAVQGAAVGWTDAPAVVGAIDVRGALGTVDIDGERRPVVVHLEHAWQDQGLTLYQGLIALPDRLYLLWFYCAGGDLTFVYYEGTDGTPLAYQAARGTCREQPAAVVTVETPALDIPIPPLVDGFAIDDDAIHLAGASPGWLEVGGRTMDLYVFQHVDCARCGQPGWDELHALLWDDDARRLHVTSLYLGAGGVRLIGWWSLPGPPVLHDEYLAATWRRW